MSLIVQMVCAFLMIKFVIQKGIAGTEKMKLSLTVSWFLIDRVFIPCVAGFINYISN